MGVIRRIAVTVAALIVPAVIAPAWTAVASASPLATVNVPPELRTGRALLVRPHSVEVVRSGKILRSISLTGPLDLSRLPNLIGDTAYVSWQAKGVLRLGAVLRAGSLSTVTGGLPVLNRLELGDAGGGPARLLGAHATVRLNGVTVAAVPAQQGGPTEPGSLRFSDSTVELTATTLAGLGAVPADRAKAEHPAIPALRTRGGTVTITDSVVTGGGDGLVVIDAANLTLQRVRAQQTGGDGIRLRGGAAGTIGAVTSTGNRRYGVMIAGSIRARLAGPFTLGGNRTAGLGVVGASHLDISNVASTKDQTGVRLKGVSAVNLAQVTTQDDKRGVVVEGGNGVRLSKVSTTRDDAGVTIAASQAVTLTQVTSSHARRAGISVDGDTVTIASSTVTDAQDGLVIPAKSRNVTVRGSAFSGSRNGVRVASASGPVVLAGSRLDSAKGSALRITGPGTTVDSCTVTGATGITVRGKGRLVATGTVVTVQNHAVDIGRGVGPATMKGGAVTSRDSVAVSAAGTSLTMDGVQIEGGEVGVQAHGEFVGQGLRLSATGTGIRLSKGAQASVSDSTVTAGNIGIAAAMGAAATLTNTDVHAALASRGKVTFRGPNRWSHEPMRWLGVGVLVALTLGILMEMLRTINYRRERRCGLAPIHVLNRS